MDQSAAATTPAARAAEELHIGVVLFDGFEPLDWVGPVNIWALLPGAVVHYVARSAGPVTSVTAGVTVLAGHSFNDPPQRLDWLLVPGGIGTRREVGAQDLLSFLRRAAQQVRVLLSVCTGSVLLAAAGLLHGRTATSNKVAWSWVVQHGGGQVRWQPSARWVKDAGVGEGCGEVWTSSGVAAGMDMACDVVRAEFGMAVMDKVAARIEYQPSLDSSRDPFATAACSLPQG